MKSDCGRIWRRGSRKDGRGGRMRHCSVTGRDAPLQWRPDARTDRKSIRRRSALLGNQIVKLLEAFRLAAATGGGDTGTEGEKGRSRWPGGKSMRLLIAATAGENATELRRRLGRTQRRTHLHANVTERAMGRHLQTQRGSF